MVTSYHNHTRWSDGDATLAGHIQAARRAGLAELGISDHYVLYPGGEEVVLRAGGAEAVEGGGREAGLGRRGRKRSCHRVPFGRDGGGYEDAHGGRRWIRRPGSSA